MFERFTRDARAVVAGAAAEATALRHDRIGTEHLLLALATGDGGAAAAVGIEPAALRSAVESLPGAPAAGLDADALASIGIDLDEVRRRVEASFGPGALAPRRRRGLGRALNRRPFTPRAKRALEMSLREALALGHNHIGPGHILLGVVRDPGSGAAAALRHGGTSAEAVRAAALAALRTAA
jgi:ATP-dependent Clp protease ATP-binding subunit ClpA